MASEECIDERFVEAEERAERALYRDYPAAGEALRQIRDEERACWVPVYRTWERYLQERWEISRQHANYLIQAAEVVADLSSQDDAPRIPLRHAALLHRFKSQDLRRELAAAIAPLRFPDAQRRVIAAARESRGEGPSEPLAHDGTNDALVTLRSIFAHCRALDMSATVVAVSRLEARRNKDVLEELDSASSRLATLGTMVRRRGTGRPSSGA
jgi:hypothetical protein